MPGLPIPCFPYGLVPTAAFTFIVTGLSVAFTYTGEGAEITTWDFGDGTGRTANNPTYVYASGGSYTVTLTVVSAMGTVSTSQLVSLSATNVTPPVLGADPVVGTQLAYTPGVWDNETSVSAQAQRSLDGLTGWADVGAAWDSVLGTPYTPVLDDYGYFFRAIETAEPGAVTVTSNVTNQLLLDPTTITGLAMWLDASTPTQMFQDDGVSVPVVANNDRIRRWYSKSVATGLYARYPSDAERATWLTNVQGGEAVARYIEANAVNAQFLNFGTLLRNKPYAYLFAVYNPRQTSATQRYFIRLAGATKNRLVISELNQRFRLESTRLEADANVTINSDTNHGGVACVISALMAWNDGTFALRQNGAQVASGAYASSGNSQDANLNAGSNLGSIGNLARSIGDFAEILIVEPVTALTADQIALIETYLSFRWSVTLNP